MIPTTPGSAYENDENRKRRSVFVTLMFSYRDRTTALRFILMILAAVGLQAIFTSDTE